jgi:hypothetical protein
VARGRPGTPGHTTAGKRDGKPWQPPAANLRACRGRRDPCGQRDTQPAGPMFHRSGLVRPYVPSVRSGPVRSGPVRSGAGRGGERANAFSRSPLVPRMVTGAAAGASDHRLIVASMVSRRRTQAISDLACSSGEARNRSHGPEKKWPGSRCPRPVFPDGSRPPTAGKLRACSGRRGWPRYHPQRERAGGVIAGTGPGSEPGARLPGSGRGRWSAARGGAPTRPPGAG